MLISNLGTLVRTGGDEVSVVGRNTQGVRLIKLKDGELMNSVGRIAECSLVMDTEGVEGENAAAVEGDGAGDVEGEVADSPTPAEDSDTESE